MDFPMVFKNTYILATFQFAYVNSSMEVLPTTLEFLNILLGFSAAHNFGVP